jgi:hypothetical protein
LGLIINFQNAQDIKSNLNFTVIPLMTGDEQCSNVITYCSFTLKLIPVYRWLRKSTALKFTYICTIYAFYLQMTVLGPCTISSNMQTLCVLTTRSICVLYINSVQTACIYLASNRQSLFVMGICFGLRSSGVLHSVGR